MNKSSRVRAALRRRNVFKLYKVSRVTKLLAIGDFQSNFTAHAGQLLAILSSTGLNCVNECFTNGEMSLSQKQALITLIEKKGKDRSLLDRFHLLALMPRLSLKKS